MSKQDTVQGYRVAVAKKYGVNVAIIYDKVQFWGTKGERDDGWVYKTYADMSEETALSTKQIGLAYEKLRSLGVIETKTMKVGNVPKLHFRLVEKDPTLPIGKVQNAKSIESAKTQSPIYNTETTQKTTKNNLVEELEKLISLVNQKEKPTADRQRLLSARLKEYSFGEIENAARAFSSSQWHRDNGQMTIDNLLRPSKFGRWYTEGLTLAPEEDAVEDPIVASGGVFPAKWPKGKPEWRTDDTNDREDKYFRGVKIDYTNQDEMMRIQKERSGGVK